MWNIKLDILLNNNKMKYYIFIAISLFMLSCTNKTQKRTIEASDTEISKKNEAHQEVEDLPIIDLQKDYPLKTIALQDIADVEYIPLEIREDALLSYSSFTLTDSFFIANSQNLDVCFFHRNGKLSHTFNRKGESGEEYTNINALCIDNQAKEVYVYDASQGRSKIQVYSFNGEYRRTFKYGNNISFLHSIFDYDKDYLLAEDHYSVDWEKGSKPNSTPYYKISKKDGKMVSIPLAINKPRFRDGIIFSNQDVYVAASMDISPTARINQKNIISEFVLDTIYTYQEDKFIPVAIRKNFIKKNGIPIIVALDAITRRYLLWYTAEKDIDKKKLSIPDPKTFLYDKYTGKCVQVHLFNGDGISAEVALNKLKKRISGNLHVLPNNCVMQIYPAHFLLEQNEEGKLKGELKEIASKLMEEDNPVLMLAKFQE